MGSGLDIQSPLSCVLFYTTIQDAINNAQPYETIHVQPLAGGVPRQEWLLIADHPVCLKNWQRRDFWVADAPVGAYPVTIEAPVSSCGPYPRSNCSTIAIGADGSGTCIEGFKIVLSGAGRAAVLVGDSSISGAAAHANDVTLLGNSMEVTTGGQPNPSGEQPHGINLSGKNNHIYHNQILGSLNRSSRGINMRWNPADISTCADWDGNDISSNRIGNFEDGINVYAASVSDCSTWSGNRIDFNEISSCNTGIWLGSGNEDIRLAVMGNQITAGRDYAFPDLCEPDVSSNGIVVRDTVQSDISSNSISGVHIGIHVGYDSCDNRISNNHVVAKSSGTIFANAVWICPSSCQVMTGNHLVTSDRANGTAINFDNRQKGCYPNNFMVRIRWTAA